MSNKKASWLKHLDFTIGDVFCLLIAYACACLISNGDWTFLATYYYQNVAIIMVLFSLFTSVIFESYNNILSRGYYREFIAVSKHIGITALGVFVFMFFTRPQINHSRSVFILSFVIGIILMYGSHLLWKRVVISRRAKNPSREHLLVITKKDFAEDFIKELVNKEYAEYHISGCILYDENTSDSNIEGVPIVCNFDDTIEYLKSNVVDEVIIQQEKTNKKERRLIQELVDMGVTVHIELSKMIGEFPDMRTPEFSGYKVITLSIHKIRIRQMLVKRSMDIVGSLVGLIFTGVAFVIVGPIIKKQSLGPIIFSQTRVGKNGREFKLYKFRSMIMNAEDKKQELMQDNKMQGQMFKMDNDPRITPIGHFIRKYSIDELPQFWNVLKGDMSLVGTRPPTIDEYEKYDKHHCVRLSIKPGITGMWQVSGRSNIVDFEDVVELDKKYISDWDLGLDIKILLQTLAVVLKRKGSV